MARNLNKGWESVDSLVTDLIWILVSAASFLFWFLFSLRKQKLPLTNMDLKYTYLFYISLSLILCEQLPLRLNPASLFATLKRILLVLSAQTHPPPHPQNLSPTYSLSLSGLLTAHLACVNHIAAFEPISHLATSDQIRGFEICKLMLTPSRPGSSVVIDYTRPNYIDITFILTGLPFKLLRFTEVWI